MGKSFYTDRYGNEIRHGTIFRWWAGGERNIPQFYIALNHDEYGLRFYSFPVMREIELVTSTFEQWAEAVNSHIIDNHLRKLHLEVKTPDGKEPWVSILELKEKR